MNRKMTIGAQFARYVSLNVLSMIGLSCYILADTLYISAGMGSNGLTALNLVLPVYSVVSGLGQMLGLGGATRYSIARAEGESGRADRIFTRTFAAALAIGLLFTAAGLLFAGPIAKALGAEGAIFPMASVYLRTLLFYSWAFMLNQVMICFVRNDKEPKLAMIAMVTASLSNIVLDYIFIFPLGMGMFGAAFATGISPLISMGILSIHIIRKRNGFHLVRCRIRLQQIGKISVLGLSALLAELSSGIVMLVFNFTVLRLSGNVGVAAYGVIANLALMVMAVFNGIAQGSQPLLSSALGKGDSQSIHKVRNYALLLSAGLGIVCYLGAVSCPEILTGIFNREGNPELTRLAVRGIYLYFLNFPFMGINMIMAAYFSAVARPKPSLMISLTRGFALVVPLLLLMPVLFGMTGVWLAVPLTEALTSMLCMVLIRKYRLMF
ncbi:MATE family efflux transporter [Anaerolentibacter hominis]|uniref:MATE family efflux transporter n=1 Tax=Anaerolentibacter hominis TaxID=3079009 RepID=UPI0031B88D1F